MDLGTVHHMAINVADYEKTREFYVDKLGFQVLGEYVFSSGTRRMDCQLGDIRLEIFQSDRIVTRSPEPYLGYRHLCFRPGDIHAAAAELKALGVQVEELRPDPMAGGLMTFFRDPEGLILELHE